MGTNSKQNEEKEHETNKTSVIGVHLSFFLICITNGFTENKNKLNPSLRCIIPVVFYANWEGVGKSKHNCLCILFIRLTTCFGHRGPSSGHKNIQWGENIQYENISCCTHSELSKRFRFLWPCIVSKVWGERKPTRCNNQMFINNFCLNMFPAPLCPFSGEQRPCYCIWCTAPVLLDVVGGPTTTTSHIQQNQSSTPYAVPRSLFSWRWA